MLNPLNTTSTTIQVQNVGLAIMNLKHVMCLALLNRNPPYYVAHLLRETALVIFNKRTFAY